MGNKYGRNQKRRAKAEIIELRNELYNTQMRLFDMAKKHNYFFEEFQRQNKRLVEIEKGSVLNIKGGFYHQIVCEDRRHVRIDVDPVVIQIEKSVFIQRRDAGRSKLLFIRQKTDELAAFYSIQVERILKELFHVEN